MKLVYKDYTVRVFVLKTINKTSEVFSSVLFVYKKLSKTYAG